MISDFEPVFGEIPGFADGFAALVGFGGRLSSLWRVRLQAHLAPIGICRGFVLVGKRDLDF